jgi:hypothetical protein
LRLFYFLVDFSFGRTIIPNRDTVPGRHGTT